MSTAYRILRTTWRRIAPEWANRFAFSGTSKLSKAILTLKAMLEKRASHNELYDAQYYLKNRSIMARDAAAIVQSISLRVAVKTVIDVGCGAGEILERFRDLNVSGRGLEYSDAALEVCRGKGLHVRRYDLEGEEQLDDWKAELVLSTGVAGHLRSEHADKYVKLLCQLATRFILVTPANPGQGGTDVVNPQSHGYWIEKFERHHAHYLADLSRLLQSEWSKAGVSSQHARNVLLFQAPISRELAPERFPRAS